MKYFSQLCAAIALSVIAVGAHATVHQYIVNNPGGSAGGGDIKNITTTYNTENSTFSWEYSIDDVNDGFWLVVSDGPNPKGTTDQLAILYGDLDNNVLTAYQYNGQNNSNSFQTPGVMLDQWSGALSSNTTAGIETTAFSINVAAINALNIGADWEGIQFGETIGIWFHPSQGSTFTYANGDSGEITGYSRTGAGWHDTGNRTTTEIPVGPNEVPAPNALLLLALGLLGLVYARRQAS